MLLYHSHSHKGNVISSFMHCNIYKPVFHHGDACTCNVSFYNVQSMELHSYTCIHQKFCKLSFIPFYQCILLYMAAHTPSFTIFWSRGWPHNAVRISTFCASSASAFYHTVWITPEARCKQSDRICGWCECEVFNHSWQWLM